MTRILLAAGLLLTLNAGAATKDVKDVVSQARAALGGEAKLAALKSLSVSGKYKRSMGPGGMMIQRQVHGEDKKAEAPTVIDGTLELDFLLPDKFLRSETMRMPFGDGPTLLDGLDGENAWNDSRSPGGNMMIMRRMGPGPAGVTPLQRSKAQFARFLLLWTMSAQPGFPIEFSYAGEADAPDGKADAIDCKGPDGFAARIYLDQQSHLPLMMTYQAQVAKRMPMMRRLEGQPPKSREEIQAELAKMPPPELKTVEFQIRVSDYEKAGGIQLPKLMIWSSEGQTTEELEVQKYTVNPKLKPEKFRK